jgi:hypothetical protein
MSGSTMISGFIGPCLGWCGIIFPQLMALFYLALKIACKYCIRNFAGLEYDKWEVLSWFGADLALLNIALSISLRIHKLPVFAGSDENVTLWYIGLAILFGFAIVIYTSLNKLLANRQRLSWFGWGRVWVQMTLLYGLGFVPFLTITLLTMERNG